jgi:predicted nucleotidyltransferase
VSPVVNCNEGTLPDNAPMSNRAEILAALQARRPEIGGRLGVRHLGLFGSAARDELRPDSDIDVLVEFDGPVTFDRYFQLKDFLEQLLCRPVDVVTVGGLKPRARRHVEQALISLA